MGKTEYKEQVRMTTAEQDALAAQSGGTLMEMRDRVIYRDGIDPQFLVAAWLIGFVMGMLLAMVMEIC